MQERAEQQRDLAAMGQEGLREMRLKLAREKVAKSQHARTLVGSFGVYLGESYQAKQGRRYLEDPDAAEAAMRKAEEKRDRKAARRAR